MAYFSNGTDHDCYEVKYCLGCLHYQQTEGACPVMDVHFWLNYRDNEAILSMLIPYEDGVNGKCLMYIEGKPSNQMDFKF